MTQQHLGTINGIPVLGSVKLVGLPDGIQFITGEIVLPDAADLARLEQASSWVYVGPCTDMAELVRSVRVKTRMSFEPTRNNSLVFYSVESPARQLALVC